MSTALKDKVMEVKYVDLAAQFEEERHGLMPIVEHVLASGQYVMGEAVDLLEQEVAAYLGVKEVVALNSGTDALILGLKCLGIGPCDEVITPPNSFIASTGAIVHLGATPVFCDVREDQNIDPDQIERLITPRTKALMPVHLTGRVCDMDAIMGLARKHGLKLIEDAAQSMGSTWKGQKSGTFGDVGCFSCHPLKNLNACGDGGLMSTNDSAIAERARRLRTHGLIDRNTAPEFGIVSRMDIIQAEILRWRLKHTLIPAYERRRRNVELYRKLLDPKHVFISPDRNEEFSTYVLFVVQVDRRDALQKHLKDRGIGTAIHYPTPIHLQPAAKPYGYKKGDFPMVDRQSDRILSLPHHPYVSEEQIRYVCETINGFYR